MLRGNDEYLHDHLYISIYYDRATSRYSYGILLAAQDKAYGTVVTHAASLDYTWFLNKNPHTNRWALRNIRAPQYDIGTLVARILLRKFSPSNRAHLEPALDKYLKMVPIRQDDPQLNSVSWTHAAIRLLVENKVIKNYVPLRLLIKDVSEFPRRVNEYDTAGQRLSFPVTASGHYIVPTDGFLFMADVQGFLL